MFSKLSSSATVQAVLRGRRLLFGCVLRALRGLRCDVTRRLLSLLSSVLHTDVQRLPTKPPG